MIWHSSDFKDVLNSFSVDPQCGLANGEADRLLEEHGKNTITRIERPSFLKHLTHLLRSKVIIALAVVSIVSLIISLIYEQSSPYASLLILAVVVLNAVISAWHLYSGDKVLNSLQNRTIPTTTVLRDSKEMSIPSDMLVPGDIILLSEGDYISADARLIETVEFRCNETSLTGESVPVEKNADAVFEDISPIEERANMVFSGTSVVHGTAKAIVVATGLNTENGRSAAISQQIGADTLPLQSVLDRTGRIVNIVVLAVCIVYFLIGMLRNFESGRFAAMTFKMLVDTLALGVAAVPESLPMISTLVIALGIERIVADKIIIKKTDAVELLGCTSVICSDKTGILTHDSMTLLKIFDGTEMLEPETQALTEKSALVLKLAAACSTLSHDSTERTITDACIKYNAMSQIDIENLFPRLNEIPFDPVRKSMTTINMINGKPFAIVKGAPEMLIEKCIGCDREAIIKLNDELAEDGLRIICIAMKPLAEIPASPQAEDIENNLVFVGLLGLYDPPRNEAIEGIKACDNAGIRTIMMTGDNPITARAVARRIGILKDGTELITGTELEELSDDELIESITKYSVYARISPADKVRIVKAWQQRGELVTVTGDGVEDADALSIADIGCSVGKNGTDVARGSADTVITNNSFLSVVSAVKESRGLFENIRKTVFYLLSCNFGELLAFITSMLIFGFAPMSAVQLLWVNLLTDCAPAISLSLEKAEDSVMKRKPYALTGHIFDAHSVIIGILHSVFIAAMTLITFSIGKGIGTDHAMTMAFTTLGMIQIFHSYNLKFSGSVFASFKEIFTSNRIMTLSNALALFVILFLTFTPAGFIFGMTILSIKRFAVCLCLAIAVIPFCEIIKLAEYLIAKRK